MRALTKTDNILDAALIGQKHNRKTAGKETPVKRSHTSAAYPADKPHPTFYRPKGLISGLPARFYSAPSSAQRTTAKRQHKKKARQFLARELRREQEELASSLPV